MRKLLLIIAILAAFSIGILGCYPDVLPDVKRMDTSSFPNEAGWIAPGKTWWSNYQPGEAREQTLLLAAPKFYTTTKLVSTVDGDSGVLEQKLDVIPKYNDPIAGQISLQSEHVGDNLVIDKYDSETNTVVISGFDSIELKRIVQFTYIPDSFSYALYYGERRGIDSGKELVESPVFADAPENTADWVTFSHNGQASQNYILLDSPPMTTQEINVTLAVPEGEILPPSWEFRIGTTDITGKEFVYGVTIYTEMNYKFLVSDGELKISKEYRDEG